MTHRSIVELTFALLMLGVLALASWMPENLLLQNLPFYLVLAMVVWFEGITRGNSGERTRHIAWLWPTIALATGAQLVWFSPAADRSQAVLMGAALVVAVSVLAIVRKRRA